MTSEILQFKDEERLTISSDEILMLHHHSPHLTYHRTPGNVSVDNSDIQPNSTCLNFVNGNDFIASRLFEANLISSFTTLISFFIKLSFDTFSNGEWFLYEV
jgi:hypothetical protein